MDSSKLRPLERCVMERLAEGRDPGDVGRMFRRSPQFASRVAELGGLHRHPTVEPRRALSPLERRVLHWRGRGLDHDEIGRRFRRGPGHIAQIERMATWKLANR